MTAHPSKKNLIALLIEDDPVFRQVVTISLAKRNFDVVEAVNFEEGLEVIENTSLSFVITDIFMEGMGGIAVERTIEFSTNPPGGQVTIDNVNRGIEPVMLTLTGDEPNHMVCVTWRVGPICRIIVSRDLSKGSYTFNKEQ